MTKSALKLKNPPIVEAVLDFDCAMSPTFNLAGMEIAFRESFRDHYPIFKKQMHQGFQFEAKIDEAPKLTTSQGLQALQVLHEDQKQIVQFRPQGFSFNRLTPYSSLDVYLPEIELAWKEFIKLAVPIQIRQIRLRYINRLLLPLSDGNLDLDHYFVGGPKLPDEERLVFVGFLNQHSAIEKETGNRVNIVLAAQSPENDKLPVILDITAQSEATCEVDEWNKILPTIQTLRSLKNSVFEKTLTQPCLNLFQPL